MEKSKLISNVIVRLRLAYPSYFNKLTNEELILLTQMYIDELSSYNENTLLIAIKNVIRNNKYMPSLNDIISECEKNKTHNANTIIESMIKDGYFKNANEIDKAYKFIEENNIPGWLKEDMKKYITLELGNKEQLKIGVDS